MSIYIQALCVKSPIFGYEIFLLEAALVTETMFSLNYFYKWDEFIT